MVADKGKRSKLAGKGEGEDFDHVNEQFLARIEKLQEVQDELDKVNEEANDKVLEVEKKYSEMRRPIYSRRKEIIQSIPEFWLTSILSHPILADLMNENDQKIMKHFVSLDVEDFKDLKSGYSITFNFMPNPYFENKKLTKTINYSDEATTSITGTAIKWKEGMDNANGSGHVTEGAKRPFEEDSFFDWFNEAKQKALSDELDDEIAEIIKEDLWPNPLKYFNNDADEEDFVGDDDDDEGTENEEDDNNDEDDNGQDGNAQDDRS